ncbi:hypothetical protein IWW50_001995 [Coemansia erecta]|nr:hypothetical protein IWW50_001995 [Coemansia erecta]
MKLPMLAVLLSGLTAAHSVAIHHAQPYLSAHNTTFGALIEGAAVDHHGAFYAVHYNSSKAAVGQAFPAQSQLFADRARPDSWFNAVRFNTDQHGVREAFLGDVANHRVVCVRDVGGRGTYAHSETFCHSADMLQPNDLAIAHTTGRLFLSGMRFAADSTVGDGDLWTCDAHGVATKLGSFHRTNGIEVSPDERTLYLSEAVDRGGQVVSNVIHAFDLDARTGAIGNRRVFADFGQLDGSASHDVDGIRADVRGYLYVARWGAGKVAVLSPDGRLEAYVQLGTIREVTNLELAGAAGNELFIVGACTDDPAKGCVERWAAPARGRAFSKLHDSSIRFVN